MALVSFTLSEEGVGAFNDALICIHKFSDDVSLEVKKDKVSMSLIPQIDCETRLTNGWSLSWSSPH